jgi:FkbM family methyltransferase
VADQREQAAIRRVMKDIVSPCIVELGAHTGEDEEWIRLACAADDEDIHYVMVEPDPRNCNALLNRPHSEGHPRPINRSRRLIIGAVSDQNGEALFHMSENPRDKNHASGSLLEPTGHVTGMPWITFEKRTWVQTLTLDALFRREWLTKIDLLWTDIQGSERQMIAGGAVALSHTRYCFMETEGTELYRGQALRKELVQMMAERRFAIDDVFPYNVLFRNTAFKEREPR